MLLCPLAMYTYPLAPQLELQLQSHSHCVKGYYEYKVLIVPVFHDPIIFIVVRCAKADDQDPVV